MVSSAMFLSLQYLLFIPWSIRFHLAIVCILVSLQLLLKGKKMYITSSCGLILVYGGLQQQQWCAVITSGLYQGPWGDSISYIIFHHHQGWSSQQIATWVVIHADIRHFHPSHPNSILHWTEDDMTMIT